MKRRVVPRMPPTSTKPPGYLPTAQSTPPPQIVHLRICKRGYVYAGSVKIGQYVTARRTLRILDRCRGRSERRGSRFVEVSIDEFPALELKRCEAIDVDL